METVNIENVLFPENGQLKFDEDGNAEAQIVDIELDPIDCSFGNDGCVEIKTEDYSYITLSRENLYKLIELIDQAEDHYEDLTIN